MKYSQLCKDYPAKKHLDLNISGVVKAGDLYGILVV